MSDGNKIESSMFFSSQNPYAYIAACIDASSSMKPLLIDQLKASVKIFLFTLGTGMKPKAKGQLHSKISLCLIKFYKPTILSICEICPLGVTINFFITKRKK
jgi:hypothetical protein